MKAEVEEVGSEFALPVLENIRNAADEHAADQRTMHGVVDLIVHETYEKLTVPEPAETVVR